MKKQLFAVVCAAGLLAPASALAQRYDDDQYDRSDRSGQPTRERAKSDRQRYSEEAREEYRSARSERGPSEHRATEHKEQQQERQAQQRTFKKALDEFFDKNDENEDGRLSRDELPSELRENFGELDSNSDEQIARSEFRQHAKKLQRMAALPVEVTYIWICGANRDHLHVADLQQAYDLLRQVDVNEDGQITRSEIGRRHQQVAARWASSMVECCDENQDGRIAREEAAGTALDQDFDRFDRNNDDSITGRELRLAARQIGGGYAERSGESEDESSGDEQGKSDRSRTAQSEEEDYE